MNLHPAGVFAVFPMHRRLASRRKNNLLPTACAREMAVDNRKNVICVQRNTCNLDGRIGVRENKREKKSYENSSAKTIRRDGERRR